MKQPKHFKKTMAGWFMLVLLMFASLASYAQEAYVNVSTDRTTLTFYYDDLMSTRPGVCYYLNKYANSIPDWNISSAGITTVVFDSLFVDARPSTTSSWFKDMKNLTSITGLEYVNTSMAKDFYHMFDGCSSLTSLDLSTINTQQVRNVQAMFQGCRSLVTIYVSDDWVTPSGLSGNMNMFYQCTSLVGGQGTVFDPTHIDGDYGHIDGGPDNPGYFTKKPNGMRGDVNGDTKVDITDATMLINYLLDNDPTGINMENANCDLDGGVDISDATALINFLLENNW
ncbi:MAG: BspA family leucine-rich repeat surface protein [Muribaculaceae bacterium]|nr:BspA family leucine-rich repeat surface protein [Muribaculaceae bacterium]